MNIIALSPHFPPNFQRFWLRLAEEGAHVIGISDAPFADIGGELQRRLIEYFRVDDMEDYDQLLRAVGFLTWRHGRIDRIESHNEHWLETEAGLRTDFAVRGPHRDDIVRVKRKSRMKEVFRAAGVTVARGRVPADGADARALADELGYPVVAKPDIGVGAAGAARLDDAASLDAFFSDKQASEYIVEEFIDGDLCSFDGLTDGDGKIIFCTQHMFNAGILDIVQGNEDMFYYSLRDLEPDLEAAGRATVAAFELCDRFFHIEFFRRRADAKVVALELNMRPPGGLTADMFNYANEFDIYHEYAKLIVHGRFEATWNRPLHCVYIGRKDHLTYAHSHDDVLARAGSMICHHERVQSVFAPAIGDYAYLARPPQLEPLLELTRFALEK